MFSKIVRFGIYGSLATSGTIVALEAQNSDTLSSIGVVRFGRAALTVNSPINKSFINPTNLNPDSPKRQFQ